MPERMAKLYRWLLLPIGALIGLHLIRDGFPGNIHAAFNLDWEHNLPSWYSTVLLFMIALIALIAQTGRPPAGRSRSLFWFAFAGCFAFLSMDEAILLHERVDRYFGISWVYVYAPAAAIFFGACVLYGYLARRTDGVFWRWIIGGLVIYALGGMGAEVSRLSLANWSGWSSALENVEIVLEEGLEMLGATTVLIGCLYEASHFYGVTRVHEPGSPGASTGGTL